MLTRATRETRATRLRPTSAGAGVDQRRVCSSICRTASPGEPLCKTTRTVSRVRPRSRRASPRRPAATCPTSRPEWTGRQSDTVSPPSPNLSKLAHSLERVPRLSTPADTRSPSRASSRARIHPRNSSPPTRSPEPPPARPPSVPRVLTVTMARFSTRSTSESPPLSSGKVSGNPGPCAITTAIRRPALSPTVQFLQSALQRASLPTSRPNPRYRSAPTTTGRSTRCFVNQARLSTPASAVDRRNPPLAVVVARPDSVATRDDSPSRRSRGRCSRAAIPRAGTRARRLRSRARSALAASVSWSRVVRPTAGADTKHDGELIVRVGTSEGEDEPERGDVSRQTHGGRRGRGA